MTVVPRMLILSGSTRSGSYNTLLARIAEQLLQEAGAKTALINLTDFDMPIYNGDIQQQLGIPAPAMALKQQFKEADGLLFASPEHNMSPSALLKNTIDWVSRATAHESGKVPFEGKAAALCSASTGGLGGQRGLLHLRLMLTGLGMHVLPAVVGIGNAATAFDANGQLKDQSQVSALRSLAQSAVELTRRLHATASGARNESK